MKRFAKNPTEVVIGYLIQILSRSTDRALTFSELCHEVESQLIAGRVRNYGNVANLVTDALDLAVSAKIVSVDLKANAQKSYRLPPAPAKKENDMLPIAQSAGLAGFLRPNRQTLPKRQVNGKKEKAKVDKAENPPPVPPSQIIQESEFGNPSASSFTNLLWPLGNPMTISFPQPRRQQCRPRQPCRCGQRPKRLKRPKRGRPARKLKRVKCARKKAKAPRKKPRRVAAKKRQKLN